jgi:L-fuconolactonase
VEILDAQLHCWLSDRPSRPWLPGYREATGERALNILLQTGVPMPPETLLTEMAAAGVDGGVLTPQGVYGPDNSFELEVSENYPRKFAVVGWADPLAFDLEESLTRDAALGMLGIRLLYLNAARLAAGEFDAAFAAAAANGLAIALSLPHPVPPELQRVFQQYEDTQFLIDHLGVGLAPPAYGLAPDDPFERLPAVLALSRYPNVCVKLTGAPALSHERYPFRDIWPAVLQLVDSFGPERVLWGSDITRTGSLATYFEHTHYLREVSELPGEALALIYGRALRRVLAWDPEAYLTRGGVAVSR